MKKATLLLLAMLIPAIAQEPGAPTNQEVLESLRQGRDADRQLLQDSRQILQKLDRMERTLAGSNPAPAAIPAELEERLRLLEEKLAAASGSAPAAPEAGGSNAAAEIQSKMNGLWIIIAAALVFVMQAGFCLLELGLTRAKNAINICMKNFLDFAVGALAFFFVGFALMFGASDSGWFGAGPFWLSSIPGDSAFWAFWIFQVVFSATAATIISGAMAERTKFIGYLVFTALMTGLIYPIAGHWAWGSFAGGFGYGGDKGWLESLGYVDFAGSSVVHSIGGAAALAGILVVGPRIGRFRADGTATLISGHNLPMAALGTFLLWFGWFGFNVGSLLAVDHSLGRIAVNTTLSASAGAVIGMFAMWLHQGRPDLLMTLNGALGGLVGITANCHCVSPASAVLIGVVAGIIATAGSILLERLRIDDAVGAVPVHLFCGWWGVLAVAIFNEAGFSPAKLGIQALGAASITAFAFITAYIGFVLINKTIGIRATDNEQDLGLDFTEHSGTAYPDFITGEMKS